MAYPLPSTLYPPLSTSIEILYLPGPSGVEMTVSTFVVMMNRQTQIVTLNSLTRLDRPSRRHLRISSTLYPLPSTSIEILYRL